MRLVCRLVGQGQKQEGTSQRGAWRRQNFIVETIEQFPNTVCVSVWNDLIDEFAQIQLGTEMAIEVSLSSREYNEKWYSEIKALSYDFNVQTYAPQPQYQQGYQQRPMYGQQQGYQQRPQQQYQQYQQPQYQQQRPQVQQAPQPQPQVQPAQTQQQGNVTSDDLPF